MRNEWRRRLKWLEAVEKETLAARKSSEWAAR
jgi:hypothetical protein